MSPLLHTIPVEVGIDTYAEADLVDIQLVKQLKLKPCQNINLLILQAINQQSLLTHGAFNLRLELTDRYGTRRTTLRLYLVVDRGLGDSQILLGIPALTELKVLLDYDTSQ
jgi:hypothetical protein